MIFRNFRFKLYLSPTQEAQSRQFAGACRFVYNLALEQRRDWWRNFERINGRHINSASQSTEVTQLRKEIDWLAAVPRSCLSSVLKDLEKAFNNFFLKGYGYPRPRTKEKNSSFSFEGREISVRRLNSKWAYVRLPKIGWTKIRYTKSIIGKITKGTVTLGPLGWMVSITCEIEHKAPDAIPARVGVDRGVTTTLALSTGEALSLPASLNKIELRNKKSQRVVSRRKRGSNRWREAKKRVAKLAAKQARIRLDFHHRSALDISKRFGVAVLEALKIKNMTKSARGTVSAPGCNIQQKAGLNRVILNAGWYQFATILTYKIEERGGQVITVPAAYSSQTCAACGVIDARSRENQAVFECVSCGHRDHADTNAAIEILRRGNTSLLRVEGSGCGPVEARTLAVREHGLNLALV